MRVELFELIDKSAGTLINHYYIVNLDNGGDVYFYSQKAHWIVVPLDLYLDERYKLVAIVNPVIVKLLGIEEELSVPARY